MQGELFGTSQNIQNIRTQAARADFLDRPLIHLSLGQFLITLIALLVFFVLVFSFGVEKGKRYAVQELRAERSKREKVMEELKIRMLSDQDHQIHSKVVSFSEAEANRQAADIELSQIESKSAEPTKLPQGKYTIQIVTFKGQKMANDFIDRLSTKGFQGFVIPSGKFLQVCVNQFESKDQATFTLKTLREMGLAPKDAYIRPLPSPTS